MKKVVKVLLTASIVFTLFIINNYVFAQSSSVNEENKNYRFSTKDIKSEEIIKLYNPENTFIPNKFSLKDLINIPVSNQQSLGLCDTFAIVKSAETNYALKYGKYIDLSERYLDYMTSKDFYGYRQIGSLSSGIEGDGTNSSDILSILETYGAPTEAQIPYKDYQTSEYSKITNAKPAIMVKSTVELPGIQDLKDEKLKNEWINILKIHIMKYGAVNSPIVAPNEETYNYTTNAQYYKEGVTSAYSGGHAISIIGWDDNYSKDNFKTKPAGNGAFICLNSWGSDWGDNGYFYISYYDDNILVQFSGVLDTVNPQTYKEYTYSEKLFESTGWVQDINSNRFYGVKFTKKSTDNEYLDHITFAAGGLLSDDTYTVKTKVYLNPKSSSFSKSKMILLGETNVITNGGTSNISLDTPIKIEGKKFSLVFEFMCNTSDMICFSNSVNKQGSFITGNLYNTKSIDSSWNKASDEFPVFAFTVNSTKNISSASISKVPSKNTYKQGEKLDLSGGKILVNYSDNSKEEININSKDIKITGYDSTKVGNQTLKITYKGKSVGSFNIKIESPEEEIQKLETVKNVTSSTQSTSTITLKWDKVENATGYQVYMATSETGTYKKIKTIKENTTVKYKKTDLTPGQLYYFKVRAYQTINKKKQYSEYSTILKVSTKIERPVISKVSTSSKKATVKWNKIENVDGYEVFMSTSQNGVFTKIATIDKNTTVKYKKTNLTSGQTYYFCVRAYKTVGNEKVYSTYSAVSSVKVK